jgi:hypothetical protein
MGKLIKLRLLVALFISLFVLGGCGGSESSSSSDENGGSTNTDAPRIYVTRNAAPVYSGTGPYPFGNVLPGESSNSVIFSITNSGGQELIIESVSITGDNAEDFSHDFSGSTSIGANQSIDIICLFSPSSSIEGPRYAQLNLVHNDSIATSPYVIKLQGFVVLATPEISVQDATNNTLISGSGSKFFGSVLEGTGLVVETFTIKNSGNAQLNLDPDGNGVPNISVSDANFILDSTMTATSLAKYGEAGSSTTFQISYDPPASGYHSGIVTIVSNDSDESSYTFTVSGNAIASAVSQPEINVKIGSVNYGSGSTYAYGSLLRGQSSGPVTVTIQNLGNADLTIVSVIPSVAPFTYAGAPVSPLAAGASTSFTVNFQPVASGPFNSSVVINSSDADEGAYTINLTGTGVQPNIAVVPNSGPEDFGTHIVGSSTPVVFTVQNTGTSVLNITDIDLAGADASRFNIESYPTTTIPPGADSTMIVSFKPNDSAIAVPTTYNAQIDIDSDDIDDPTYTVTLTGEGNTNPVLTMTSSPTNLGSSNEGVPGGTYGYTIQNTGTTNLTITLPVRMTSTGLATGDDFDVITQPIAVVTPGSTTSFNVQFDPRFKQTGVLNDVVRIVNNDSGNEDINVSASSLDLVPSIIVRVGGVNYAHTDIYDFGGISNTTTAQATFTIENTGTYDSNITAIGGLVGRFTETGGAFNIVPGGTYTFTVTYDPTGVIAGAHSDTLEIDWNDQSLAVPVNNDYNITINGTGLAPDIDVTEAAVNVPDGAAPYTIQGAPQIVNVGSVGAQKVFVITNSGSENLTISNVSIGNTADFSLDYQPSSIIAAGGGTSQFAVSFRPSDSTIMTQTTESTTVTIINNDDPSDGDTEQTFNFTVDGFTANPNSQISMLAAPNNYGSIEVGSSSSAQTYIIRNAGTTDLEINTISLTGATDYSLDLTADFGGLPNVRINPGDTKSFTCTFTPAAIADPIVDTVRINYDDNTGAPQDLDIAITGKGIASGAELTLSEAPTNFGSVDVGSSSPVMNFTIKNTGSSDLTITTVAEDAGDIGQFTTNGAGFDGSVITAGTTGTFTIQYIPLAVGAHTMNVRITSNVADYVFTVNGVGTGEPNISVTPVTDYNYGTVDEESGGFVDRTFRITNIGQILLTIADGAVSVDDITNFSFPAAVDDGPFNLAAGANDTFTVRFNPSDVRGNVNTIVRINSNDPDTPNYSFPVTATASASEISVVSAVSDFGSVDNDGAGGSLRTYTFTVQNSGTANLDIAAGAITAPTAHFTIAAAGLPASIAPGGTYSFDVTFDPQADGALSDTVTIASDAINDATYDIAVSGTGVALAPAATVVPTTGAAARYNFGTTVINQSSSMVVVQIENTGTADLTITALNAGGANPGEFTINDTTSTPVTPGSTTFFTVSHSPSSSGPHTLDLTIDTNLAVDPIVYFTGAVSEPVIDLQVGGADPGGFGATDFGDSAGVQNLTIDNSAGSAHLSVTNVTIGGAHPGDFVLTKPALPYTVNSGANSGGAFTVDFVPTAAGARTATITVSSNDPDDPAMNIVVNGNGNALPVFDMPVLALGSISDTLIGTSQEYMITINNSGGNGLDVNSGPVLAGADASEFSVTTDTAISDLATGNDGSVNFGVTFAPTTLGTKNATLMFTSNDPVNTTRTLALSGKSVSFTTIDSDASDRGQYADIAVRQTAGATATVETIYVSYYDAGTTSLMFTRSTDGGTTWMTPEEVDTPNVGQYSSIAVDEDNDDVFITYYDTAGSLKYAYSTSNGDTTTWASAVIDNGAGNDVGQWASMTNDSTNLYVSYYDATQGDIKLAFDTNAGLRGGAFAGTVLDNTSPLDAAGGADNIGQYSSMSNDGAGNFYLTYYDTTNFDIKTIRYNGAVFGPIDPTPVIAGPFSFTSTASQSGSNVVYVTYFDTANGDLGYSVTLNQGANWSDGWVVQPPTVVGEYSSSIVDWNGDLHVAFYDQTNSRLMHGLFNGTWTIQTVDNSADVGKWTSIAAYEDTIYIIYYDDTNNAGDLKIAKSIDGGASW